MVMLDLAWASCFTFLTLFIFLGGWLGLWAGNEVGNIPSSVAWAFALLLLWSLRLSKFLMDKIRKKVVDERYSLLKERNGEKWPRLKFLLFPFEAVLVFVLFLPFALIGSQEVHGLDQVGGFFYLGLALFGFSLLGEVIADGQLKKFKRIRKSPSEICQVGLWKYSRHPNYFFECLIWLSFFFLALGLLREKSIFYVILMLLSPGLMVYLILFVTGIPINEELALKKKGESYRNYQKTTSALVPWFRKKGMGEGE